MGNTFFSRCQVFTHATAWERAAALFFAGGVIAVFLVASRLNPYDPATGEPLSVGTHTQLGLPPCNFLAMSGFPCPSCGMTTSFALLMRGDMVAGWRANGAGIFLAFLGWVALPWCLLAGLGGRLWWFFRLESGLLTGLLAGLAITLLRWMVVSGVIALGRLGEIK